MFLCFSHKYRIQNKLSKTVEIELEKVFFVKRNIFNLVDSQDHPIEIQFEENSTEIK